jgi:hypothetical protein
VTEEALELAITSTAASDGQSCGPLGAGAVALRCVLVRVLWCALHPERGLFGMPAGWFDGGLAEIAIIPKPRTVDADFEHCNVLLQQLFAGHPIPLVEWVGSRTMAQAHPFEVAVREADLEAIIEFAAKR